MMKITHSFLCNDKKQSLNLSLFYYFQTINTLACKEFLETSDILAPKET